jgi:hypothetical protein
MHERRRVEREVRLVDERTQFAMTTEQCAHGRRIAALERRQRNAVRWAQRFPRTGGVPSRRRRELPRTVDRARFSIAEGRRKEAALRGGLRFFAAALLIVAACGDRADSRNAADPERGDTAMMQTSNPADPIRGRTLRWTWVNGLPGDSIPGEPTHEHTFNEDGTVTWRVIGGPQAGHSAVERQYAVMPIGEDVYMISYLAASGYTLTATLNFRDMSMVGIASGQTEWFPGHGTFEVVR